MIVVRDPVYKKAFFFSSKKRVIFSKEGMVLLQNLGDFPSGVASSLCGVPIFLVGGED